MSTTENVIGGLDELIAIAQERFDNLAFPQMAYGEHLIELLSDAHAYKDRIAALVEAARPFDRADLFEENSAYMNASVTVKVGQLRALSAALKGMGQ